MWGLGGDVTFMAGIRVSLEESMLRSMGHGDFELLGMEWGTALGPEELQGWDLV